MELSPGILTLITIAALVALLVLLTGIVREFRHEFVIFDYEKGLLYRFGVLQSMLDSGRHVHWGRGYTLERFDTRLQSAVIGGQEILTRDGIAVRVSSIAWFNIADPKRAMESSASFLSEAYQLGQIALRDVITSLTADEVVEQRALISERMTEACRSDAEALGLKLQKIELRDITFPGELRRAMAQVALAQKEGQAALERARGESAALRHLANAAKLLEANPTLMQLRILHSLSDARATTVVLNTGDAPVAPLAQSKGES